MQGSKTGFIATMEKAVFRENSLFHYYGQVNKKLASVAMVLFLTSCIWLPAPREVGKIEGKTVYGTDRVSGALVVASSHIGIHDREKQFTTLTTEEGEFRLSVPPGTYYLSFSKDADVYGFFGGNPVTVTLMKSSRVVLRGVRWSGRKVSEPSRGSYIEGTAMLDGALLPGSSVHVFLDAREHFRGPGYAMARSDQSGRFSFSLPPGRYFIVARQRKGEAAVGPLLVGDRYSYYPGNPIYLGENETVNIELPFLEVMKDPSRALEEASGVSLIKGTITGEKGEPVAGVFACLYKNPEPMGMPAFISDKTGTTGAFTIRVTGAGTYFLVARGSIGRPLELDEHVAFYRGPSGHRVDIEPGEDIAGISILWGAD